MIFRAVFICLLAWILTSCGRGEPSGSLTVSSEASGGLYRTNLDPDERIALAKKRKSYMSGIRKGDFYSLRHAPEEALSYYLSVA